VKAEESRRRPALYGRKAASACGGRLVIWSNGFLVLPGAPAIKPASQRRNAGSLICAAESAGCWKNSAAADRHAPIPSMLPSGGTARRNCGSESATFAKDPQLRSESMFCGEPVEPAQTNVSCATTTPVCPNGIPPAAVLVQSASAIQTSGRSEQ